MLIYYKLRIDYIFQNWYIFVEQDSYWLLLKIIICSKDIMNIYIYSYKELKKKFKKHYKNNDTPSYISNQIEYIILLKENIK